MSIFPNGKREGGMIAYLQGLAYRVTMRVMHRYGWHYMPDLPGRPILWCHWCGIRHEKPDTIFEIAAAARFIDIEPSGAETAPDQRSFSRPECNRK